MAGVSTTRSSSTTFRILNEEGLRLEDEFVKHKILDAIGDLYLLGHSVLGAFSGHKSGHASNNALLRRVLANPQRVGGCYVRDGTRNRRSDFIRSPGLRLTPSGSLDRRFQPPRQPLRQVSESRCA